MDCDHKPVMVREFIEFFKDKNIDTFVDGTLGLGGHSMAIMENHPEIKTLVAIDEDYIAQKKAKENLRRFSYKVNFVLENFRELESVLSEMNITAVDGIFLDLGISSLQIDSPERGMSFSKDGPLDMRRNSNSELTAKKIVNRWPQKKLEEIFRVYGEDPSWRIIARTIVEARSNKKINTTKELVDILMPILSKRHRRKIHPMTLLFQALRIAVNDELGALREVLPAAISLLKPGGLLGVISFHSLEDRIVKRTFRLAASNDSISQEIGGITLPPYPTGKIITRKPLTPTPEEIRENPRSRSAKMRFIEKLPNSPQGAFHNKINIMR